MGQGCKDCSRGTVEERKFFPIYQDCRFTITAGKGECFDCAKKRYIKNFDMAEAENIARIERSRLLVNWCLFLDVYHDKKKYRRGYYDELVDILLSLEIFSCKSLNCFEIVNVDCGINMNPRRFESRILYFTRAQDAQEYARLEFSNTEYNWEAHLINHVYTKEFLTKEK